MPHNPPLKDWHGKTVWLVGASSGIGQATAHALHARGARVIVSARNAAALDTFVQDHPGATALPLDVTDAHAVRGATQTVLATGPLDLVMYCAGYYKALRATGFDLEEMLRHQQVNYIGALYLIETVLPALRQRGQGHLCLTGSVAGYSGLPNGLAYGPTKAALINLAETLYVDLKDSGIGVSLVSPGFVETPLTAQNHFSMPALISPAQAADGILAGWAAGEFEIHFPKRFTRWMKLLRILPYALYFPVVRKFTGL
ncbi:MAG: SDR family NAD(P)-dependent oxidoreductase [Polaromonas sp.]|nr:SDR family NAD(P)-dependent oxidoreductase [Polaromonas sp.]